jgi:hypothetical protein
LRDFIARGAGDRRQETQEQRPSGLVRYLHPDLPPNNETKVRCIARVVNARCA